VKPTWKHKLGFYLWWKFGRKVPDIIYEGIVHPELVKEGENLKQDYQICITNNEGAEFLYLAAESKFKSLNTDVSPYNCERPLLKAAAPMQVKSKQP